MSHIVVGYDGSAGSEKALRWAVKESKLRKAPLTICHAWQVPYAFEAVLPWPVDTVRKMAEHVLEKAVFIAEGLAPQVKIRKVLSSGGAVPALLHEAPGAALVVVGAHGAGGFEGLAVGSAALQVPGHTFCPAVVVRGTSTPGGRIVVGVDGSPASDAALGFALEEAVLRRLEVTAVHAAPEAAGDPDAKRAAGSRLQTQVAPWCTKHPYVQVHTKLAEKPPREALLEAAEGAALLVVGDRGTGGIPGLRLGAVSDALLQLAPCPVAVAHHP